jgi:hypothetical protein
MMIAARALRNLGRPAVDRLLARAAGVADRAGDPGAGTAAIWHASSDGSLLQGIGERRSLLVRGMARADAALARLRGAPNPRGG